MANLRLEIPAKMLPFQTQAMRHKIARGGRGSGKSHSIGRILTAKTRSRPMRVLCVREVQKSIKESSKRLLEDTIETLGLSSFYDCQRDIIKGANGSEFAFAGLKDHTADSLKSYEGFDICWLEEAHSISERSASILIPTIRKKGSELWWSYNPDQESDYVHQMAETPDDNVLVCDINWRDNPWFPAELELERQRLLRINTDLYNHVWEGHCRSAAGLMFKRDWFRFYDALPSHLNYYIASDYAVTPDDGDFTEHGVFGLADTGDLYVVDWWHGQTDPATWIDAWLALVSRYRPLACFEEAGVILRAVTGSIDRRQRETGTFANRVSLPSAGGKAERALGFAARASAGAVYLPKGEMGLRILNQLCAFNGEDGRQDDAVDVCSLVGRGIAMMAEGSAPTVGAGERKLGLDYGIHDDDDEDDRTDWKTL